MAKILGIDFGLKKIGLAFSEGELAEPLGTIQKTPKTINKIKNICEERTINKIVIGLPESGIVNEVKQFGKGLERTIHLPIIYQEETLTSQDAVSKMLEGGRSKKFRRQQEDAIAAAIILQNYLEGN